MGVMAVGTDPYSEQPRGGGGLNPSYQSAPQLNILSRIMRRGCYVCNGCVVCVYVSGVLCVVMHERVFLCVCVCWFVFVLA